MDKKHVPDGVMTPIFGQEEFNNSLLEMRTAILSLNIPANMSGPIQFGWLLKGIKAYVHTIQFYPESGSFYRQMPFDGFMKIEFNG